MAQQIENSKGCMQRTVIFLNGELHNAEAIRRYLDGSTYYIAADGGARHAGNFGVKLHAIVGDLDSITPEDLRLYESQGTILRRFPVEKDASDLELAIEYALELRSDEIHLVGIEGGRSDHFLAILGMLANSRFSSVRLCAHDAEHVICALTPGSQLSIATQIGFRHSLIPLSLEVLGVCIEGVKWPLSEARLELGNSLSLSNVSTSKSVKVSISDGALIVVSEREGLDMKMKHE